MLLFIGVLILKMLQPNRFYQGRKLKNEFIGKISNLHYYFLKKNCRKLKLYIHCSIILINYYNRD